MFPMFPLTLPLFFPQCDVPAVAEGGGGWGPGFTRPRHEWDTLAISELVSLHTNTPGVADREIYSLYSLYSL